MVKKKEKKDALVDVTVKHGTTFQYQGHRYRRGDVFAVEVSLFERHADRLVPAPKEPEPPGAIEQND